MHRHAGRAPAVAPDARGVLPRIRSRRRSADRLGSSRSPARSAALALARATASRRSARSRATSPSTSSCSCGAVPRRRRAAQRRRRRSARTRSTRAAPAARTRDVVGVVVRASARRWSTTTRCRSSTCSRSTAARVTPAARRARRRRYRPAPPADRLARGPALDGSAAPLGYSDRRHAVPPSRHARAAADARGVTRDAVADHLIRIGLPLVRVSISVYVAAQHDGSFSTVADRYRSLGVGRCRARLQAQGRGDRQRFGRAAETGSGSGSAAGTGSGSGSAARKPAAVRGERSRNRQRLGDGRL